MNNATSSGDNATIECISLRACRGNFAPVFVFALALVRGAHAGS